MYKTLFKIKNFLKHPKSSFEARRDFEPGHFYSPIPSKQDIEEGFKNLNYEISDIVFNLEGQLKNLEEFEKFYSDVPFKKGQGECKYFYSNDAYQYFDGVCLYSMIRKLKPKRIIEVGSGYSSALMDDVNKIFFGGKIDMICIEPYPQKLKRIFKNDIKNIRLIDKKLQNIPLEIFKNLEENDILFIDSTHVSKFNSDVNKIIFEILPVLKDGVYIHFHDIFFPFEYPRPWLEWGWSWNENYTLRAFLMNNKKYRIEFFNTYVHHFYKEKLETLFPEAKMNPGGSIWLKKMPT